VAEEESQYQMEFDKQTDKDNEGLQEMVEVNEHHYAAVKVIPAERSCEPAKWIKDKVYLLGELSELPLKSCTKPEKCNCKLEYFEDRRDAYRQANSQPGKKRRATD
jgi:hypothetical protein